MSAVTFPGARTLGALVAVFFAAVPRLSRGAALDTTAFAWRMPVTVSGYEGASALTDFPVLVTLSAGSPAGFNYSLCAADGSDLRFADGAGALIPHEIETWDAAGTSFVWVKVPTLSGKATALTGYFGTNGVDALPSVAATDVWTRYAAVFHGGATIADATGKAAAVTPQTVSGAASGGKAGGAMTKSSGLGFTFTNPVISGALSTIGSFSFSGWFKKSGGTTAVLLSNKGRNEWQQNGFVALVEQGTYFSVGSKGHQGTSGKGALAVGTWGHLAFSYDKSATKLDSYFDGESIHSTSSALAIVDPGKAVWSFGGFFDSPDNAFQGSMDELRILNGTASADWIKAERDSVADPASFAVLSPVESTAAGVPVIASASFEETTPDSVWTLAATLGANDAALTLVLSADGRADVEIPAGDATEGVAVTKAVSPAIDDIDTTVLWRVKLVAANASGSAEWTFPGAVDFAPTATTRGDFAKKFAVTVPAGFADESLASFPLLVRLSAANIPGFDYGDFRRDGADLRVEDEAGNPLPHELETWNAGGESLLWVSAPAVAEGTHLTVYYGAARRCPVPAGMWSGYAGVWHLDEAGDGAVTVADATANALDGMANELSVAQAQGVLGGARGVDKNKAFPLVLVPAANASALALAPTFTASGWLRPWTTESSYRYILSRRYNDKTSAWGLQFRGGTSGNVGTIAVYSNGAVDNDDNRVLFNTRDAFAANKWTKYAVVYTETTATLYLDGALAATGALKPGAPADGALPFSIGGVSRETDASLNADHDEVRLRRGAASAAWIAAEYRQEANTVPLVYDPAAPNDPTLPVLSAPVVTRNADGSFTISTTVSENAPASVTCLVGGDEYEMATADAALPATYGVTLDALAAGTYTASVRAESTGGARVTRAVLTVFHVGALSVERVADADEGTLSPGAFRISRADADATGLSALTFAVDFSGAGVDAVAGPLPATVTIPAGEKSVDVAVTPVHTTAVDADAPLVLTVTGGNIGAGSAGSILVVNAPFDPAVRYVATTGDDANHGGTRELPKKTIAAAVESLELVAWTRPCTVHVAPGLYPSQVELSVALPIRILGDGETPSDVVVSNAVASGNSRQHQRVFVLGNAGALVANLTMQKGEGYGTSQNGGNFYVNSDGGTVSNCLSEAGYTRDNSQGAGGYLDGGLVTHTVFRGNKSNSASISWANNRAGVLVVNKTARAENCLFAGNNQNKAVTLINVFGSGVLRNCTIVASELAATNEYCTAWSALNIGSTATAQNVVVAGVTNTVDGATCLPTGTVANFHSGAVDGDIAGRGFPSETIVGSAAALFRDCERGDWRPKSGGALVNSGENYAGMPATDLAGKNRRVGARVDIGCYEAAAAGLTLVVR